MNALLLDTGPLVAFLAADTQHTAWVREEWGRAEPPMLTCEPVLTEAAFILKREARIRTRFLLCWRGRSFAWLFNSKRSGQTFRH